MLENVLQKAITALTTAARTFRHYEHLHSAKTSPDKPKAQRNARHAELMEKALAALQESDIHTLPSCDDVEVERDVRDCYDYGRGHYTVDADTATVSFIGVPLDEARRIEATIQKWKEKANDAKR